MSGPALTRPAAAMFRALAARAGLDPERTLLLSATIRDWHSLTLDGERQRFELRLCGPAAAAAAETLCSGLAEAEFDLPGWIVADVALVGGPVGAVDGAVDLIFEALVIRD